MTAQPTGPSPPDIWIVGLGIVGVDHVTAEADRALRSSRVVLVLDHGVATPELLSSRCGRVVDLTRHYSPGRPRNDSYERMAAEVIDIALEGGPVTLAVHGHPLAFAYPAFLVRDLAVALGLTVWWQPGISAADTVLTALGVEPGLHGLLQHEATDLLLRRRPVPPDVPLLLWQVGMLGTAGHTESTVPAALHGRLRDHLARFHPSDHVVTAIYCSPHPLMRDTIHQVPLADLPTLAPLLHPGFSLFVPASEWRPISDVALLRSL